jgi:stage V sporulation protein R
LVTQTKLLEPDMSDNFLFGSPVLFGSATTPGVPIPEELNKHIPTIFKACKDFGLDFYPTIVQMLSHDEMSEVASYGGFASRYPHWKFGAEYEEMQRGYLYGNHRIYEMVVNCLNPETRITTNRGTILASDVNSGDIVFGQKGPREVAKVVRQNKIKTLRIKLKNQFRTINCTENHKWLAMKSDGPTWIKAVDIKPNDILIGCDLRETNINNSFKINYDKKTVIYSTRKNIQHCIKDICIPKEMTLELAELLGILIGDGCIGGKGSENLLVVAVGLEHEYYAKHVSNLFELVFGEKGKIYKKSSCYTVTFCSKMAVDFMDTIGLTKGCIHKNKKVPFSIWQSSQEYREAFVKGLFDTDGHCSTSISYSSKSKNLIEEIQLILSEMGIYTVAKHINNKHNNIFVCNLSGRMSIKKFCNRFKLESKQKVKGTEKLSNTAFCSSGGLKIPFIQSLLMKDSSKIKSCKSKSIYYSNKTMNKKTVGLNSVFSCYERMIDCKFAISQKLSEYLNIPYYEVESVSDSQESETIDIALYHNDHDFVAEGLISHNTNPSYLYCLNSNTLLDNITVIAHALGHVHFFKNNIHFSRTNTNAHNELANNGSNIRKYISRYGNEEVGEFMDMLMRVETLVDTSNIWKDRIAKDVVITDKKEYKFPKRIITNHDYMEDWVNTKEFIDGQNKKIQSDEMVKDLGILSHPETDIFGYIKDHAPFKPWQRDIAEMLYNEAIYFSPQGKTKVCNEAFASWTDYNIMAKQGYCGLGQENYDDGIVEYAIHKAGVLGGKYSTNPYKLGFSFLMDIEDRWNKGKFGTEYEECRDELRKENWDENLNLGKQKVFDVCKNYDDYQLINEFFTKDFCEKYEFFEYKKHPNGEIKIESRDHKKIKKGLLKKHINRGLPIIKLLAPRLKGKIFFMEHQWDGLEIYRPYATEVIRSIAWLCKSSVALQTKNQNSEDIVYYLNADIGYFLDIDVKVMTKAQFLKI